MSIKVEIKKNFGDFKLNIAFEGNSKRIGILGASGCGKSMTLKSIAGIVRPDEGYIEIDGRVVFDSKAVRRQAIEKQDNGSKKTSGKVNLKPQQRNIGYLFQNYALFPTMTVEKNIEAGLKGRKEEKRKRVADMIEKFELQGLEKRYPKQLSGGQQQRVALARIMAYEPDVILLDEPFSALDVFLKDRLQQEMKELLKDYPGIVIMVSHSRDEIYRFSEELLIMDQGKAVAFGKTKELFDNPGVRQAAILTGCKNITRLERLDAHHAYLPDWDVHVEVEKEIPGNTEYLGYRAHFFEPVWEEESITGRHNLIKIQVESVAELPFEQNYYVRPEKKSENKRGEEKLLWQKGKNGDENLQKQRISWIVQKELLETIQKQGLPVFLRLREDAMMFLTK
ncbi:MAG: ATP-binding cassette domain-containing protein [Dorea sp.]|nr:ATP-binding cassette domain-containing protein [Dorea sp.]